jgi:hypothetical protein
MEKSKTEKTSAWLKTPYANLIRYQSSGKYFARLRIKGKLIVRSLKTNAITVAKLRLADLEKEERQKVENQVSAIDGTMTFGDALAIYQQRLTGDISLSRLTILRRDCKHSGRFGHWRAKKGAGSKSP